MQEWLVTAGTLVAALGGIAGLASLLTIRVTRRKLASEGSKNEADAAKVLSDTAVSLLAPARQQVTDLQGQVEHLADQLDGAQREVRKLRLDVRALTDRLGEAQRLLTRHGVPFPPLSD